ncbi:MAG: DUF983 domain-containing protein [Alphaproteobacteria bacterium]|nr:DUF983 domain-containing protein [Alphaproteobacteria bacterium]MDE2336672.1 DUF983 domain-containing protein [Alphaproteobacteria bacterium]
MSLLDDIRFCLKPRCPVCREGRLFKPWSVDPVEECAICHTRLGETDVGDGASVFMIFLLGATVVPLALVVDHFFSPPLWVHAVLWGGVMLGMIAVILPAVKAYVILLEYRHRPKR